MMRLLLACLLFSPAIHAAPTEAPAEPSEAPVDPSEASGEPSSEPHEDPAHDHPHYNGTVSLVGPFESKGTVEEGSASGFIMNVGGQLVLDDKSKIVVKADSVAGFYGAEQSLVGGSRVVLDSFSHFGFKGSRFRMANSSIDALKAPFLAAFFLGSSSLENSVINFGVDGDTGASAKVKFHGALEMNNSEVHLGDYGVFRLEGDGAIEAANITVVSDAELRINVSKKLVLRGPDSVKLERHASVQVAAVQFGLDDASINIKEHGSLVVDGGPRLIITDPVNIGVHATLKFKMSPSIVCVLTKPISVDDYKVINVEMVDDSALENFPYGHCHASNADVPEKHRLF